MAVANPLVPAADLHWTYQRVEAGSDLIQGDILARTDDLVTLLTEVHAHFRDEKYLGFMVVTQSCDLVRRVSDSCKAHYISLAVIRSLNPMLDTLFQAYGTEHFGEVYFGERKQTATQLVERILNQNEQSIGLFYLHPDLDAGISEASVALLRVTIALRAEHYDMLIAARRGRLKPEFANKLGWLVGNLYSRVATPDWDDFESKEFKRLCKDLVSKGGRRYWLPKAQIDNAIEQKVNDEALAGEAAVNRIKEVAPKSPKARALDRVREIGNELFGTVDDGIFQDLVKRLQNDQTFSNAFRND